jgi:hypothetical protein
MLAPRLAWTVNAQSLRNNPISPPEARLWARHRPPSSDGVETRFEPHARFRPPAKARLCDLGGAACAAGLLHSLAVDLITKSPASGLFELSAR